MRLRLRPMASETKPGVQFATTDAAFCAMASMYDAVTAPPVASSIRAGSQAFTP